MKAQVFKHEHDGWGWLHICQSDHPRAPSLSREWTYASWEAALEGAVRHMKWHAELKAK